LNFAGPSIRSERGSNVGFQTIYFDLRSDGGCAAIVRAEYGEINGTVSDPTGAVIAGATVTVTNTATNIARNVQTNASGNYTVPFLAPGLYDVRAEQAGFKAVRRADVQLQVGASAQINIAMEVGEVTETVAVTGTAALLTTQGTAVVP